MQLFQKQQQQQRQQQEYGIAHYYRTETEATKSAPKGAIDLLTCYYFNNLRMRYLFNIIIRKRAYDYYIKKL